MIKTIFTFSQVQIESLRRHAVEPLQAAFGIRPETFYFVDVNIADSKNIVRVIDSQMFGITDIEQSVITAPAVRMNDRIQSNAPANNVLQRFLSRVRNNLSINFTVSLIDAEDDLLAAGSTPALASNAACSEIKLIDFDFATGKWRRAF